MYSKKMQKVMRLFITAAFKCLNSKWGIRRRDARQRSEEILYKLHVLRDSMVNPVHPLVATEKENRLSAARFEKKLVTLRELLRKAENRKTRMPIRDDHRGDIPARERWNTMSQIAGQVHSKFKVFAGELQADKTIGPLAGEIEKFVSGASIAPKSIGVEYIESAQRLIITLGYRDDEPGYSIKINCVSLGKIDSVASDFSALEEAMSRASQTQTNIICHELYVTEDHDLLMIFMTHQA